MTTYTIIKFDESAGQIVVRFDASMAPVAIDLPVENGLYPTGEALDTYIKGFIPTWHIERINTVKAGIANAADIAALVTPEEEDSFLQEQAAQLAQIEAEKRASDRAFITDIINEVLAARGL